MLHEVVDYRGYPFPPRITGREKHDRTALQESPSMRADREDFRWVQHRARHAIP